MLVFSNLSLSKEHKKELDSITFKEEDDRKYINTLFEFVLLDNGITLESNTEKATLTKKLKSIEQLDAMQSKNIQHTENLSNCIAFVWVNVIYLFD